jgi:hypothetical protein
MSAIYNKFHCSNIKQEKAKKDGEISDMISLAELCADGTYNKLTSISCLRLSNNKPTNMIYWDFDSAYDYFVTKNKLIDPETREPINKGFVKRLINQKKVVNSIIPEKEVLQDMFSTYLTNPETNTDILKVFLHMDDTGFMTEWLDVQGEDIRTKALETIATKEPKSWLIRKSSVVDSDIIKTRVITYVRADKTICHHLIAHIYGFGYAILQAERSEEMVNLGENKSFPKIFNNIVYGSFIEILEALKHHIDLTKLI